MAMNAEQRFVHLQQQMHFWSSITGAPKPTWLMAPTGHCLTMGQGWFCGQNSCLMTITWHLSVFYRRKWARLRCRAC